MGLFDSLKTLFQPKPKKGEAVKHGKGRRSGRTDIRERFELLREAISGTMSKFYMARDRQTEEIVGLKILDPKKTADYEARFKGLKKPSEGEISFKLKHPNIVETYEYGLTKNGEQYLVMEFIEGPGLNSILVGANRQMLEGHRLPLIRQIAEALKAVHEAEFIHRDMCPRNIMVEPNKGVLKLIDFGLTVPAKPEFMQPGNRTGNPNYMAPELIRRKRTDQRIDVFSFGVTAYELFMYTLPWPRGMTGKAAISHATDPPVPLLDVRPQTHRVLAEAIMWCLEQNVAKRCPSMGEFLKAIKSVETDDAV